MFTFFFLLFHNALSLLLSPLTLSFLSSLETAEDEGNNQMFSTKYIKIANALCERLHTNFFIFINVSKQRFWLSDLKHSQSWSGFVALSITGLNQAVPGFPLLFHQTFHPVYPASCWISNVVFLALSLQLGCSLLFFSFLLRSEVFIRSDDESATLNEVSSSRKTHSTWFVTTEKSEKLHWKHCHCSKAARVSVSTLDRGYLISSSSCTKKPNSNSLSVISCRLIVQLLPIFLWFHSSFQDIRYAPQLEKIKKGAWGTENTDFVCHS